MSTRVDGKTIRLMATEFMPIKTALDMKANGMKINNMEKVSKLGRMAHLTKEVISKAKSTVKVYLNGRTAVHMKVPLLITTSKVMEFISGQMNVHIQGTGKTTKWMERVCLHGQMAEPTKVSM